MYVGIEPAVLVNLLDHVEEYQTTRFESLETSAPAHIVEDTERPLHDITMDDRRVLVSTWRCYSLHIDVALFHIGPLDQPREPILEAMRNAHCPH